VPRDNRALDSLFGHMETRPFVSQSADRLQSIVQFEQGSASFTLTLISDNMFYLFRKTKIGSAFLGLSETMT
jgi:hypothetical protein